MVCAQVLLRFVEGIDGASVQMDPAETAELQDDFAQAVILPLAPEQRPVDLAGVALALETHGGDTHKGMTFFVGDGSQVGYNSFEP